VTQLVLGNVGTDKQIPTYLILFQLYSWFRSVFLMLHQVSYGIGLCLYQHQVQRYRILMQSILACAILGGQKDSKSRYIRKAQIILMLTCCIRCIGYMLIFHITQRYSYNTSCSDEELLLSLYQLVFIFGFGIASYLLFCPTRAYC
jgi:hypothetical protein